MKDTTNVNQYLKAYLLDENEETISPELQEWLDESDRNRREFEAYRKIWNKIRHIYVTKKFDAALAWENIDELNQSRLARRKRKSQIIRFTSGIAATILLCVLLYFSGWIQNDAAPAMAIEMETARGSRSQISLPDGTNVSLNSGSKISYVFNSKEKRREIIFTGEGFFEVAKDKTPFVITTSDGLQIKVLGTTFNLTAYEDEETVETTLIEGSVEISNASNRLTLTPGETGSYDKKENTLQHIDKIGSNAYGWMNNVIYMDDMPLDELCRRLERTYDVNITLQKGLGEKIRYNGALHEESIGDMLNTLQKLSKIKYGVKGKDIIITLK
jgi:ferric-dicitrate binding protein FerR (iron transport regulator)